MRSPFLVKLTILLAVLALTAVTMFAGHQVSADKAAQATQESGTQAGRFPLCPPGAKIAETPTETPTAAPPPEGKPVIFIGIVARSVAKCGARITAFRRGSPALAAGARVGDVIVAVDGTPIDSSTAFFVAVAAKNPGDTVVLTVDRTLPRRGAPTPTPADGAVSGVRIAPNVEELDIAVVVGEVAAPSPAAPSEPNATPEATSES